MRDVRSEAAAVSRQCKAELESLFGKIESGGSDMVLLTINLIHAGCDSHPTRAGLQAIADACRFFGRRGVDLLS
jgi:hypothetical protein